MSYSITSEDVISLNFDARLDGQQVLCCTNWFVGSVSPGVAVDSDSFFAAWASLLDTLGELGSQLASSYSEDVLGLTYVFQRIAPVRMVKKVIASAFDVGQVAESALPPNVEHAVTIRPDVAVPPIRGVHKIGGVPVSWSVDGYLAGGGIAQLDNLGTALRSSRTIIVGADSVNVDPIILNKAAPGMSPVATSHIVSDTTHVMRRRTVRLGS